MQGNATDEAVLTWDSLGSNNIGEDGARALAEALMKNTTLTTLE